MLETNKRSCPIHASTKDFLPLPNSPSTRARKLPNHDTASRYVTNQVNSNQHSS